MLDKSEAPLLPRSATVFRAARKRKRFRYEENADLQRPFKKWVGPAASCIGYGSFGTQEEPSIPRPAPRSGYPVNPLLLNDEQRLIDHY